MKIHRHSLLASCVAASLLLAASSNAIATNRFKTEVRGLVVSSEGTPPGSIDPTPGDTASIASTLSALQASLNFGTVEAGTLVSGTLTLKNTGTVAVSPSVSASGAGLSVGTCGSLAPGASCTVQVFGNFSALGAVTGSANVSAAGFSGTLTVPVTGNAAVGTLSASANAVNFDPVDLGDSDLSKSVVFTNTSTLPVRGLAASFLNNAEGFTRNDDCGGDIAPGQHCTVNLGFTPASLGGHGDVLVLANAYRTYSVSLTGTGVTHVDTPLSDALQMTPATLDLGQVELGRSATAALTLKNKGTRALTPVMASNVSTVTVGQCGPLAAGASCTVAVNGTPVLVAYYYSTLTATAAGYSGGVSATTSGSGQVGSLTPSVPSVNFGTTAWASRHRVPA